MDSNESERVCGFCGLSKQQFEELKDRVAVLEEQLRGYQSVLEQVIESKNKEEKRTDQ